MYNRAHLRYTKEILTLEGGTGWYLVVLGQYRLVLIDTWWYWVNMERYWLIYDGTGSVEGSTGRYLVVLGQKKAILVDT